VAAVPRCRDACPQPQGDGARAGVLSGVREPSQKNRLARATLNPFLAEDIADALAFALRFQGRKRVHNADEIIAEIVADRIVEHLERAGFVVMKKPPEIGRSSLGVGRGRMTERLEMAKRKRCWRGSQTTAGKVPSACAASVCSAQRRTGGEGAAGTFPFCRAQASRLMPIP
jgi:hypothetical protein